MMIVNSILYGKCIFSTDFATTLVSQIFCNVLVLFPYPKMTTSKALSTISGAAVSEKGGLLSRVLRNTFFKQCCGNIITFCIIHPFKFECNLIFLGILTGLYSHCHNLVLLHFVTPEEASSALAVTPHSAHNPHPKLLTTTNQLSVSIDLPLLDILYKWNQKINK